MARGRFLSESVAKDLRLNSLSVEAQLVYLMTVPHLDRDGLIEGDTDVLYGTVCPKRRQFIDRMGEFIQEWAQVGLVIMFDSCEGQVLWFKGFSKNQLGLRYDRETPSKFPPPPGYERLKDGLAEIAAPQTKRKQKKDAPPDDNGVRQNDGAVQQDADEVRHLSAHADADARPEVKVQSQVEVKVEVKAQAQDVRTAPAAPSPQEDALDPKALIADLRQRQFIYLDKNATSIAAQLIADYGWDRIMEVADSVEAKHKAKIATGDHGIIAPLAYMRSVLAGTPSGSQQARGFPNQSMGEASVDKFFARLNGKGH